jgi:hypothetical protein
LDCWFRKGAEGWMVGQLYVEHDWILRKKLVMLRLMIEAGDVTTIICLYSRAETHGLEV